MASPWTAQRTVVVGKQSAMPVSGNRVLMCSSLQWHAPGASGAHCGRREGHDRVGGGGGDRDEECVHS